MRNIKVVGLGARGCGIAEEFADYPEYRIYKIHSGPNERASLSVDQQTDIEQYEKGTDTTEVGAYLRSIKPDDDVLFILGGGGPITGRSICNNLQERADRIVFGVLKEYARSGKYERMILVDTASVEELVGDVSIREYEQKFNNFVAYTMAMINYYHHSDALFDNHTNPTDISRISTFGITSLDPSADVKYLFPLEGFQDIHYYYGIPAEKLENDQTLMREIKTQTKRLTSTEINTGFSVHSTTFDQVMVLCVAHSKAIQNVKN